MYFYQMVCSQFPDMQSTANASKRLDTAAKVLGKDVLVRFLVYIFFYWASSEKPWPGYASKPGMFWSLLQATYPVPVY